MIQDRGKTGTNQQCTGMIPNCNNFPNFSETETNIEKSLSLICYIQQAKIGFRLVNLLSVVGKHAPHQTEAGSRYNALCTQEGGHTQRNLFLCRENALVTKHASTHTSEKLVWLILSFPALTY